MSADAIVYRDGPTAVPMTYQVPAGSEIAPVCLTAVFDGTSASGSFVPTLEVVDPSGHVVARVPADTTIAAGGSAECTFAPFLRAQTGAAIIQTTAPPPSGQTIVPLALVLGIRTVQPSPANFGASVGHFGYRVIVPRSGILHDLAVYIATPAGSVEVAILNTTATTRTILYKSGLVPATASHAWQVIGDPAMQVTVGDQLDIVYAATSSSNTIMWIGGLVNTATDAPSAQLPAGYVPAPNGATNLVCWVDTTSPVPYGATTTVAESLLVAQQNVPLVIGRIGDS